MYSEHSILTGMLAERLECAHLTHEGTKDLSTLSLYEDMTKLSFKSCVSLHGSKVPPLAFLLFLDCVIKKIASFFLACSSHPLPYYSGFRLLSAEKPCPRSSQWASKTCEATGQQRCQQFCQVFPPSSSSQFAVGLVCSLQISDFFSGAESFQL